jgi:Na+/H+-dicarboxylate symporter
MELQPVALLVQNGTSSQEPDRKEAASLTKPHRAMLIWGCITMFAGVAVGASLKILGKEGIKPAGEFTPYLSVLALLVVFFSMGMMCIALLGNISPRRGSRKRKDSDQTVSPQVDQLAEQPFGITEKTTELFGQSPVSMRVRDTAPHDE